MKSSLAMKLYYHNVSRSWLYDARKKIQRIAFLIGLYTVLPFLLILLAILRTKWYEEDPDDYECYERMRKWR